MPLIRHETGAFIPAVGRPGSAERLLVRHSLTVELLRAWDEIVGRESWRRAEPLLAVSEPKPHLDIAKGIVEHFVRGMDGDPFNRDGHDFKSHVAAILDQRAPNLSPDEQSELLKAAGWNADFVAAWPNDAARIRKERNAAIQRVREEHNPGHDPFVDREEDPAEARSVSVLRDYEEFESYEEALPLKATILDAPDGGQVVRVENGACTRIVRLPTIDNAAWATEATFDRACPFVRPLICGKDPRTGAPIAATFFFSRAVPSSKVILTEAVDFNKPEREFSAAFAKPTLGTEDTLRIGALRAPSVEASEKDAARPSQTPEPAF